MNDDVDAALIPASTSGPRVPHCTMDITLAWWPRAAGTPLRWMGAVPKQLRLCQQQNAREVQEQQSNQ